VSAPVAAPELTAEEVAHSERVAGRIRAEIAAAGGWISFSRYMELALYEPGLGYYSAGTHKFGAAGDFVTAPELAPVFSRCLAAQCAEVLDVLGGGDVLELGGGSGAMAADMLAELDVLGALPRRYLILEVSADLRERQRRKVSEAVPHLAGRVQWLDRLPGPLTGVVVANELLDALPVERFTVRGQEVAALGVAWGAGGFEWAEAPPAAGLREAVRRIRRSIDSEWPAGFCSEVNARLAPWLAAAGASLERGVMLFVDYGLPRREYYAPERSAGTLLCHFRHRFNDDPFARPGLQDITAWVDFTAVAEAAEGAGLGVAGYATQAHFLLGTDLARHVQDVAGPGLAQRVGLSRQAMVLTLPGEMGERFKVMALARGYDSPLRGFAVRDLRHTL
jgi:SAM-dependent MidA family methyltransferase